jgi:hypothetical protein
MKGQTSVPSLFFTKIILEFLADLFYFRNWVSVKKSYGDCIQFIICMRRVGTITEQSSHPYVKFYKFLYLREDLLFFVKVPLISVVFPS